MKDLALEFEKNPLPNLVYVKKVNLYESNQHTTITKLVNSSVNFYRVNMKFYDHLFLNMLPNILCNIFTIAYESYGFALNFTVALYEKTKSLFSYLRDRYIGTADPLFKSENVLVKSQYLENSKNDELEDEPIVSPSSVNDLDSKSNDSNTNITTSTNNKTNNETKSTISESKGVVESKKDN
jgi:hypothetical protein